MLGHINSGPLLRINQSSPRCTGPTLSSPVIGPQVAKGCGTTIIPGTSEALGLKLVPACHEGAISRRNCEAASGEGMAAFSLLHLL